MTQKWYKTLLHNKKDLEESLIYNSRTAFCDGLIQTREKEEIIIHNNLVAIDLNLKILHPLIEFVNYCESQDRDPVEVGDTYERYEAGKSEPNIIENPLNTFIQ